MNIGVDYHGVIADTAAHKQRHAFEIFGVEVGLDQCSRTGLVDRDLLSLEQYQLLLKEIYFTSKALEMPAIPNSVEALSSLA